MTIPSKTGSNGDSLVQQLDTACARGGWYSDFATRPSSPAVFMTTAFDMHGLEQLEAVAAGTQSGYIYTRDGNPNHEALASDLARLEGADLGMVTASGMGALTAVFLAMLKGGDHVVAARVLYGRTSQLLNLLKSSYQVDVTYVDGTDANAFRSALRPTTKLCLVESISNPLMEVADLPAIVEAAQGVPVLVDSTFSTPVLQKPMAQGASLVFHSVSKYLNGHGDVMLGAIVGTGDLVRRIRGVSALIGTNSNPFECWLASRGLRTLPIRMRQASATAAEVATFLTRQPAVRRVYYPGLPAHPTHAVAKRLLGEGLYGGMLSFELTGGKPAVAALFRELAEVIPFSPTLGDARSTFSYPTGTSHKFMTAAQRLECGIDDGLVRLSIGLDAPADLCADLARGLAAIH